ncbi:MAG: hypothetical protein ACK55Z_31205 [bacterium]
MPFLARLRSLPMFTKAPSPVTATWPARCVSEPCCPSEPDPAASSVDPPPGTPPCA